MAGNGVVAFVFARGGSKGLPGKNLRPLAGKPLIAHAIEHALAVPRIERVIVSTDSTDIAQVARDFGAELVAVVGSLSSFVLCTPCPARHEKVVVFS